MIIRRDYGHCTQDLSIMKKVIFLDLCSVEHYLYVTVDYNISSSRMYASIGQKAQLTMWFSAWTNDPHSMMVCVRNQHGWEGKIAGRHLGVMTWVWPGPLRVSEVKGRNTCNEGGFFSEDSLLFGSPVSFFILQHTMSSETLDILMD